MIHADQTCRQTRLLSSLNRDVQTIEVQAETVNQTIWCYKLQDDRLHFFNSVHALGKRYWLIIPNQIPTGPCTKQSHHVCVHGRNKKTLLLFQGLDKKRQDAGKIN